MSNLQERQHKIELSDCEDEDLIFFFQEGDVFSFEEIVKRYKDPLMNFVYRFLGDSIESEDVVQETFLRVFRNKKAYKKIAKFSKDLYTFLRIFSQYSSGQKN